jgi:hypothetical protein
MQKTDKKVDKIMQFLLLGDKDYVENAYNTKYIWDNLIYNIHNSKNKVRIIMSNDKGIEYLKSKFTTKQLNNVEIIKMDNLIDKAHENEFIDKNYFYSMFNKTNNLKKYPNKKGVIEHNFGNAVDFIKFAGAYYAPENTLVEYCDLDLECDPTKGQQQIIKDKDNTKFVPHIMPIVKGYGDFGDLARTNLSIDDMIKMADSGKIDIYLNQRGHFITESGNKNLMESAAKMLRGETNSVPQSYYELSTNTKIPGYCGTYLTNPKLAKNMLKLFVGIDETSVTGNERMKLYHNGVQDKNPSHLKFWVTKFDKLVRGIPTPLSFQQYTMNNPGVSNPEL